VRHYRWTFHTTEHFTEHSRHDNERRVTGR